MGAEIQASSGPKPGRTRILYLDYLRILTTYAVILMHVSSQNWNVVPLDSFEWRVFSLYNCAKSFELPVFIMLTGILFLDNDRPLSIKSLYTKNIFRMVTTFFFWSAVYSLNEYLGGYNIWYVTDTFLRGHVHMWYLYLIIGYYICVPIFRQITLSKRSCEYFLVVSALWLMIIPTGFSLVNYLNWPWLTPKLRPLEAWFHSVQFGLTGVLLPYFVLGYYLHKFDLKPWLRKIMPVLALMAYAIRVIFCDHYVLNTGSRDVPLVFEGIDIPVAITAFLFGKHVLSKWKPEGKALTLVKSLSNNSFGIYLVHMLVMYKLKEWFGLSTLSFNPIFSIPVIALIIMTISYGISWVMHQIPVIKKYVV